MYAGLRVHAPGILLEFNQGGITGKKMVTSTEVLRAFAGQLVKWLHVIQILKKRKKSNITNEALQRVVVLFKKITFIQRYNAIIWARTCYLLINCISKAALPKVSISGTVPIQRNNTVKDDSEIGFLVGDGGRCLLVTIRTKRSDWEIGPKC